MPRPLPAGRRLATVAVAVGLATSAAACGSPGGQAGALRTQPSPSLRPAPSGAGSLSAAPARPVSMYRLLAGGVALPNPTLTPGTTFPGTTAAQVCAAHYRVGVGEAHVSARRRAFEAYDVDYSAHARYELDHLVPVALGGDNSAGNLWPQPLAGAAGARLKDALEIRLVDLVCAHKVALGRAQRALTTNWWAAYHTYGAVPAAKLPLVGAPKVLPGQVGNGLPCVHKGVTGFTRNKHVPLTCGKSADGTLRWAKRY